VEASIQEKVTASISKEKRNLQSPKKRFGECMMQAAPKCNPASSVKDDSATIEGTFN
jgi:hypothetical protein